MISEKQKQERDELRSKWYRLRGIDDNEWLFDLKKKKKLNQQDGNKKQQFIIY